MPTVLDQMLSSKESSQKHDYVNNDFLAGVRKDTKQFSWSYDTNPYSLP